MDLRGQRASTNYVDDTNPTGLTALRNYIGKFLYTHGIVNGAGGKPYNPAVPIGTPFGGQPQDQVPIGPDGRRSDIDWKSNDSVPGVGLMSAATGHRSNDALARSHGFRDAATMSAYYQKQQEMRTGPPVGAAQGDSWLQQLFAIHPAVMLQHVADKLNQANGQ
jgi:hypothetical protein